MGVKAIGMATTIRTMARIDQPLSSDVRRVGARPSQRATLLTADLPLMRLLQLVSPSLPVGGFTYSQGIEWAVDVGWIRTAADLEAWVGDQLGAALARVDLPLLVRMHAAAAARDPAAMAASIDRLIACPRECGAAPGGGQPRARPGGPADRLGAARGGRTGGPCSRAARRPGSPSRPPPGGSSRGSSPLGMPGPGSRIWSSRGSNACPWVRPRDSRCWRGWRP